MKKGVVVVGNRSMSNAVFKHRSDEPTYFDLVGVPQAYNVDDEMLERQYLKAQKAVHPDHIKGSPRAKMQAAEKSAALNHAYGVLKDPIKRGMYLLAVVEGIEVEEEMTVTDSRLLMYVMDEQEKITDATAPHEADVLGQVYQVKWSELLVLIKNAFRSEDYEGVTALLNRLKYTAKLIKMAQRQALVLKN